MGLRGSLAVSTASERVEGEVLIIRPGVEHRVECKGGIKAMYLDGLPFPGADVVAKRLDERSAELAEIGMLRNTDAQSELRARLDRDSGGPEKYVPDLLRALSDDPMARMTQVELSRLMSLERTAALRLFKTKTGMTFRQFKRWTGLKHAASRIVAGELVRTAALDGGFADAAHLTRTFRGSFGLTPSEAIAGLRHLTHS
jgi:transcriptional regulator GlxA family with amidase domain